jgi:hypothetical protein
MIDAKADDLRRMRQPSDLAAFGWNGRRKGPDCVPRRSTRSIIASIYLARRAYSAGHGARSLVKLHGCLDVALANYRRFWSVLVLQAAW